MASLSILLVDDEQTILEIIGDYLRDIGHVVHAAADGPSAVQFLERESIDLVITDLRMPGMDGHEVTRRARALQPSCEVVVVTGHGDLDAAVQAMRDGAIDFFRKPVALRELAACLERTARYQGMRRERDRFRERLQELSDDDRESHGLDAMIGASSGMSLVKETIRQVCRSDTTTVLVLGETGTGKELVARAIHHGSRRAAGPFVAVNCTAIPESLAESELFGHVRGAFTGATAERKGRFEMADGGTLFLDELGDMSLASQARVLRALQERRIQRVGDTRERPVDVRVVCSTNRDLLRAIDEGSFREDLYYRLSTFAIHVPPLRERGDDIVPLAEAFLARLSNEFRRPVSGFTEAAAERLRSYSYPGNVRELHNIVERALIVARGEWVDVSELTFDRNREAGPRGGSLDLRDNERALVVEALSRGDGNQVHAARLLGITRDALRRRMARYGLATDGSQR